MASGRGTIDKFGRRSKPYDSERLRLSRFVAANAVGFKITKDGNYDIQNKLLSNVGEPVGMQDATTRKYVDEAIKHLKTAIDPNNLISAVQNLRKVAAATPVGFKITKDGDYDMQNKLLSNVGEPVGMRDAATRKYVDGAIKQLKTAIDPDNLISAVHSLRQQTAKLTRQQEEKAVVGAATAARLTQPASDDIILKYIKNEISLLRGPVILQFEGCTVQPSRFYHVHGLVYLPIFMTFKVVAIMLNPKDVKILVNGIPTPEKKFIGMQLYKGNTVQFERGKSDKIHCSIVGEHSLWKEDALAQEKPIIEPTKEIASRFQFSSHL